MGSIITGLIFFQTIIFKPHLTTFMFVVSGFIGALFFGLFMYKSVKEQALGFAIIVILQLIIFTGRGIALPYIVRDVFYIGSLFLSAKLYYLFIKRYPDVKLYLRSFALALIFGLLNMAAIFFIYIINSRAGFPPPGLIFSMGRMAVLIGFGTGIGIDFYLQNRKYLLNILK